MGARGAEGVKREVVDWSSKECGSQPHSAIGAELRKCREEAPEEVRTVSDARHRRGDTQSMEDIPMEGRGRPALFEFARGLEAWNTKFSNWSANDADRKACLAEGRAGGEHEAEQN